MNATNAANKRRLSWNNIHSINSFIKISRQAAIISVIWGVGRVEIGASEREACGVGDTVVLFNVVVIALFTQW